MSQEPVLNQLIQVTAEAVVIRDGRVVDDDAPDTTSTED